MGLGGVIGLGLAGYALFTAKGTSTLIVPPEDVALVNQQPINRVDYIAQLQTIYGVDLASATPEQKQKVLNDMIREELFVQRGKELDVASIDPDVRTAMVNAVEQMAAADAISAAPSEAKLRAYYNDHRDHYSREGRMTVRDLVFATAEDANGAVQALNAGQSPDDVAARHNGRDSGKVNGEEFYFAAKIHLGDMLFQAAAPLRDGGVSAPIVQQDGVHVLAMVKNIAPLPTDFADAREQVLADYRTDAIKHVTAQDETFLRKRANVLIAKDLR
jgi:parvulin-like peptidyl-prolyl isomerase